MDEDSADGWMVEIRYGTGVRESAGRGPLGVTGWTDSGGGGPVKCKLAVGQGGWTPSHSTSQRLTALHGTPTAPSNTCCHLITGLYRLITATRLHTPTRQTSAWSRASNFIDPPPAPASLLRTIPTVPPRPDSLGICFLDAFVFLPLSPAFFQVRYLNSLAIPAPECPGTVDSGGILVSRIRNVRRPCCFRETITEDPPPPSS